MRKVVVFLIALVTAGIWGAICVLVGAPTLATAIGVVVIGGIALSQIHTNHPPGTNSRH